MYQMNKINIMSDKLINTVIMLICFLSNMQMNLTNIII